MAALPKLLTEAEQDLARAEQTRQDAEQRLGQPFKHALALSAAEADLEKVEKKIAVMQRQTPEEPTPEPERVSASPPRPELTVEAVRAYQPRGGVRSEPDQQRPHTPAAAPSAFDPMPLRPSGLQIGR